MRLHIGFFYSSKRHVNMWYSVLVTTNRPLCFVIKYLCPDLIKLIKPHSWKTTWKASCIFKRGDGSCMQQIHWTLQRVIGTLNIKLEVGCSRPLWPFLGSARIYFFRLSQEGQSNQDRARCQRNQLMQLTTTENAITYHNNLCLSLQNLE